MKEEGRAGHLAWELEYLMVAMSVKSMAELLGLDSVPEQESVWDY